VTTSTNFQKFILLVIALICVTVLMSIGEVDVAVGMPIITAVVFYGIGNGIATRAGIIASPVFSPRQVPVVMVPKRDEARINELMARLHELTDHEADELRRLIQGSPDTDN
jgi:hypothetical protein